MSSEPAGRWKLTITCPRPANRAVDDFHTQPEKVTALAAEWFGPGTELTLTARAVRLVHTLPIPISNVTEWNERLATALSCLYLDTMVEGGGYCLPRPVRTEIQEVDQ